MTTLYDLLRVHPDADGETLKWAFRQALEANRPDLHAGDADPLLQGIISNGILRDSKQRTICCRLVESEREHLQSKSRRVGVSHTLTASFAILLCTAAAGYSLLASRTPAAIETAANDGGSLITAAVVRKSDHDDTSLPPADATVKRDASAPAGVTKKTEDTEADDPARAQKADDAPPASIAPVKKADDAPPAAAAPVKKADDTPPAAAAPVKKADDTPPAAAAPVKKDDETPPAAVAPVKKADETPPAAVAPVKKADDMPPAAAAPVKKDEEVPAAAPVAGEAAETAAVQPAPRIDRQEGAGGNDGTAVSRPGASAAATAAGEKAALGFPSGAPAFRNRATFYREHGVASYRRGDFAQAISDLDEAIRLDRDDAQAYNLRGNVRDDTGDVERALADYAEAIRLDPGNAAAFDDRAILWRRKGDVDKALTDLDRAVRSNFADAKTFCDRGLIWYDKGSIDRATADFTQAFKLDPNFAHAYLRRGAVLHRSTEFNVAFTAVFQSIRVDPRTLDVSRRSARRPAPQPVAPPLILAPPASPEPRAGPADARAMPAPVEVQ